MGILCADEWTLFAAHLRNRTQCPPGCIPDVTDMRAFWRRACGRENRLRFMSAIVCHILEFTRPYAPGLRGGGISAADLGGTYHPHRQPRRRSSKEKSHRRDRSVFDITA